MELMTCRLDPLGPIPWTAIRDYAETEGAVDLDRFTTLIRACESELHAHTERQKNRMKNKATDG